MWRLIIFQSNLQVREMLNIGHHSSRNVENGPKFLKRKMEKEMFEEENEEHGFEKEEHGFDFLAIILL